MNEWRYLFALNTRCEQQSRSTHQPIEHAGGPLGIAGCDLSSQKGSRSSRLRTLVRGAVDGGEQAADDAARALGEAPRTLSSRQEVAVAPRLAPIQQQRIVAPADAQAN